LYQYLISFPIFAATLVFAINGSLAIGFDHDRLFFKGVAGLCDAGFYTISTMVSLARELRMHLSNPKKQILLR